MNQENSSLSLAELEKYIPLVLETESNDFLKISERLSMPRNIRLQHAAMGIVTEITELFELLEKPSFDLINLREECGDATWYCGIALNELNVDLTCFVELVNAKIKEVKNQESKLLILSKKFYKKYYFTKKLNHSMIAAGNILDLMKKGCFYSLDKLVISRYEDLLIDIFANMSLILELGSYTLAETFEINIAKLHKKRFKNKKFSETEAINRDISEERKTLENKNN